MSHTLFGHNFKKVYDENMSVAFISDLHLEPIENKKTFAFFDFLESAQEKYTALYILGDFFEYWVGDDDNELVNLEIKRQLKTATKNNLKIFFLHGNRDFLIGQKFEKDTGVQILKDETLIQKNDHRILIAHGDTFCTDDIEYQNLKKELRSKAWQEKFLQKPLKERIKYAQGLRAESIEKSSNKPENIMDSNPDAISNAIIAHNADILVHGHTHRPEVSQAVNGSTKVVLGSWEDEGWVFEYDQTHFELKSFLI